MLNELDRHRIGQARLLRRQGKTYDEIRAAIGPVGDDRLRTWLKGIARPPETWRSHPNREIARECRRLRAEGLTLGEIVAKTGAAVGSVSVYISGVRVPPHLEPRRQEHLRSLRGRGGEAVRQAAAQRRQARLQAARQGVGAITDRELFCVGVALYWAEGSKQKPWRRGRRVTLINSDPTVIRMFLAWLDLVGVPAEDRRYRLSIHESADVNVHGQWWATQLELPIEAFYRPTLKRHNPKPSRHNRNETYHGCLVVSVAKSSALYDLIDGSWQAIAAGNPNGAEPKLDLSELVRHGSSSHPEWCTG